MISDRHAQIDAAWSLLFQTAGPRKIAKRDRLAEAQNWRCPCCGTRMLGSGQQPNAPSLNRALDVVICQECNNRGVVRAQRRMTAIEGATECFGS